MADRSVRFLFCRSESRANFGFFPIYFGQKGPHQICLLMSFSILGDFSSSLELLTDLILWSIVSEGSDIIYRGFHWLCTLDHLSCVWPPISEGCNLIRSMDVAPTLGSLRLVLLLFLGSWIGRKKSTRANLGDSPFLWYIFLFLCTLLFCFLPL